MKIVLKNNEDHVVDYMFDQKKINIGSGPSNHIQINNRDISTFHLEIGINRDGVYFRDVSLAGWTVWEGKRVAKSVNIPITNDIELLLPGQYYLSIFPEVKSTDSTAKISRAIVWMMFFLVAFSAVIVYFNK